jgi:hypothetical protein
MIIYQKTKQTKGLLIALFDGVRINSGKIYYRCLKSILEEFFKIPTLLVINKKKVDKLYRIYFK